MILKTAKRCTPRFDCNGRNLRTIGETKPSIRGQVNNLPRISWRSWQEKPLVAPNWMWSWLKDTPLRRLGKPHRSVQIQVGGLEAIHRNVLPFITHIQYDISDPHLRDTNSLIFFHEMYRNSQMSHGPGGIGIQDKIPWHLPWLTVELVCWWSMEILFRSSSEVKHDTAC